MNYFALSFRMQQWSDERSDILLAWLTELNYEGFRQEENLFEAFISVDLFDQQALDNLLSSDYLAEWKLEYSLTEVPQANWNAIWEKDYEPIIIGSDVSVLAPFHKDVQTRYKLRIEPKMSFGTGHHETTRLMIKLMLENCFTGKKVLDMGCGTGVLGIFALMLGASHVTAVDIDEWAITNSKENFEANGFLSTSYILIQGDAKLLPPARYQIILANINRNILLADMREYTEHLEKGGLLFLSGILTDDKEIISRKAIELGLGFLSQQEENNWLSMLFSNPE